MKKVIIASKNPVKIDVTKKAFFQLFPSEAFEFEGISAQSGVSDQPTGKDETRLGALNRCQNAKKTNPGAEFYVGLEGGVYENEHVMYGYAVMHVHHISGKSSTTESCTFIVPNVIAEKIREGMELGTANDEFFKTTNSKQSGGAVSFFSNQAVTRKDYYLQPLIFALAPFANPEVYSL